MNHRLVEGNLTKLTRQAEGRASSLEQEVARLREDAMALEAALEEANSRWSSKQRRQVSCSLQESVPPNLWSRSFVFYLLSTANSVESISAGQLVYFNSDKISPRRFHHELIPLRHRFGRRGWRREPVRNHGVSVGRRWRWNNRRGCEGSHERYPEESEPHSSCGLVGHRFRCRSQW